VLTKHAVELGVARARSFGVSAVGVRNSNHFGTAAFFTRMAAQEGCVSILTTDASPAMAPWVAGRKPSARIPGPSPRPLAAGRRDGHRQHRRRARQSLPRR